MLHPYACGSGSFFGGFLALPLIGIFALTSSGHCVSPALLGRMNSVLYKQPDAPGMKPCLRRDVIFASLNQLIQPSTRYGHCERSEAIHLSDD
jgi:hypothetical protein